MIVQREPRGPVAFGRDSGFHRRLRDGAFFAVEIAVVNARAIEEQNGASC